uniref:RNA-dependent RNA polymerase n=1 Tax=Ulva mitovirus 1 TaxID=3051528 RepID=A0A9Y1YTG2_9VIRU|nr:MAG: RNA-dependent RNA polymerase [Ulva mitovirus 1]
MTKSNLNPGKGFKLPRILLTDTIRCQTGLDVRQEATKYFRLVDSMKKNIGTRQTVLRLKALNHIFLNFALKQPIPQYSHISVTKGGCPKSLRFLKRLTETPQGLQAAFSLLGYYRGIIAPGQPDFSSITDKGKEIPTALINDIVEGIDPKFGFAPRYLAPPKLLFRSKSGPNGQATVTCMRDFQALSPELLESMTVIANKQNGEDFSELLEFAQEDILVVPGSIHSKLAIKREGGGKDRVFAIVDYWTQCTLKPLHSQIAKILKTIPQDCTYNQGKGVVEMKKWSRESNDNLHSIDLKSFTDRFPRVLQSRILKRLTDDGEYSEAWDCLMSKRTFRYKKETYTWAVGQPLGAYSSWPIAALSHHIVVQFCARSVGVEPTYYLLGDDIVIKGDLLANEYRRVIALLDVEISETKSIVSPDTVEFAKRLFHKGYEISPAPIKMIQALVKDPLLIKEASDHCYERSSNNESFSDLRHSAINAFGWVTGKRKELLILCSNPINGTSFTEATRGASPTTVGANSWPLLKQETAMKAYLITKLSYLVRQYNKLMKSHAIMRADLDQLELPGMAPANRNEHPVYVSLDILTKDIERQANSLSLLLAGKRELDRDSLKEFFATSLEPITRNHKTIARHSAKLLLETYELCNNLSHYSRATGRPLGNIRPDEVINLIRVFKNPTK